MVTLEFVGSQGVEQACGVFVGPVASARPDGRIGRRVVVQDQFRARAGVGRDIPGPLPGIPVDGVRMVAEIAVKLEGLAAEGEPAPGDAIRERDEWEARQEAGVGSSKDIWRRMTENVDATADPSTDAAAEWRANQEGRIAGHEFEHHVLPGPNSPFQGLTSEGDPGMAGMERDSLFLCAAQFACTQPPIIILYECTETSVSLLLGRFLPKLGGTSGAAFFFSGRLNRPCFQSGGKCPSETIVSHPATAVTLRAASARAP